MKQLLVLGANPAWQKVLYFDKFSKNDINRAQKKLEFASGKGINFVRAVKCQNQANAMLLQFLGGKNGSYITEYLKSEEIAHFSFLAKGETRCCTSCLDLNSQLVTELIEPSPEATSQSILALLCQWVQELIHCDIAAICGTRPKNVSIELYKQAVLKAKELQKPILLDTYVDADELLSCGGDIILKINATELQKFTNITDTISGIRYLFTKYKLKYVAITSGADAAYFSDGKKEYTYTLPSLKKVINTIGCGDVASAILATNLVNGQSPQEAFKHALGGAMANTQCAICGEYSHKTAQKYTDKIQIKERL